MNNDYTDIRALTDKKPLWFDENAVPRYCEFHPDRVADIYASEVALFEVTCQACGHRFEVVDVRSPITAVEHPGFESLAELIKTKELHYGDPPNDPDCCWSGSTMNSEPRRVLQYWHRHHPEATEELAPMNDLGLPGVRVVKDTRAYFEWRRDPSLEVDITPDWVKDDPA